MNLYREKGAGDVQTTQLSCSVCVWSNDIIDCSRIEKSKRMFGEFSLKYLHLQTFNPALYSKAQVTPN